MNERAISRREQRRHASGVVAALLVGAGVLGGCAEVWQEMRGDFGPVRLGPGVTRACYLEPCGVIYAVPTGADSYVVRANDREVGSYPAGEAAYLGTFAREDSPVTIKVDGVDRSTAVLFVFEQRTY